MKNLIGQRLTVSNGFKNWLLVISCQFILLSCSTYKHISLNQFNIPECTHSIIINEPLDLVKLVLTESGFELHEIDNGFRTENKYFKDIKIKFEFIVNSNQIISNIYWRPIMKTRNVWGGYESTMYHSDLSWRPFIYSKKYNCDPYNYLISILKTNQINFSYE